MGSQGFDSQFNFIVSELSIIISLVRQVTFCTGIFVDDSESIRDTFTHLQNTA